MEQWDVIIVGAGIAGISAARTLAEGPRRRVLLVNGESVVPYKRTKLSKHIADGEPAARFALESDAWYANHGIELRTGAAVAAIDTAGHTVTLNDGSMHRYAKLILATGARPLYPPSLARSQERFPDSFHVVRESVDIDRLRSAAARARRVLIGGMGVLAVETAAELHQLGKRVTMVGAGNQLMPRHLNPRSAELLEEMLGAREISLRFGEEILGVEPVDKGGYRVELIRDAVKTDMIVVCVGVEPYIDLARDSGLSVARGIVVDDRLMTSAPDVYAAGDCAEHDGGVLTDLWHAAEYQGVVAATNASGGDAVWDGRPFRLKCEVFGSYLLSINKPREVDGLEIVEHERDGVYQCFYFDGPMLSGAVMVDDFARAKAYQTAVQERWSRDRVVEHFLSDSPTPGDS